MNDTPAFKATADSQVVKELIDKREEVYGAVVPSFVRIAQVWSGITGLDIQPTDVPLMMVGLKTVRSQITPDYSDNSDDIEGYLDIFRQIVGTDMVKARSVSEYMILKEQ
jgi:hypothetical protein